MAGETRPFEREATQGLFASRLVAQYIQRVETNWPSRDVGTDVTFLA